MLTAYLDESGTHQESKALVVGGYIADDDQWDRFSELWSKILSDYGLQDFHMTDFENRKKHFKHLSDSDRRTLLYRLTGCMKIRIRCGFATAFYSSTYQEVMSKGYLKELGNQYFWCAAICMNEIQKWANKKGHTEPINFVFEKGFAGSGLFLHSWNAARKHTYLKDFFRGAAPTFYDKREKKPLQAADIVVYETWKHLCNELVDSPRKPRWTILRLDDIPFRWFQVGETELMKVLEDRARANQP